jgi:hypothetical protein
MLPEENILILSQLISSLKEEISAVERSSNDPINNVVGTRIEKLNQEIKLTISKIKLGIKSI